jgi:hypothetical protein
MSKTNYIFLFGIILILTFLISKLIVGSYGEFVLPIILAVLVLIVSFYNPEVGLLFLVFSMLLSPEIKLAELPKRDVVVRIDDLLIFAVLIGWFMKSVFIKKLEVIVTPLLLPMFAYTFISIISTFLGILNGDVMFQKAFFYLLKYVEYFVIYFLVTNIVKDKKYILVYLVGFIITAIIVNIHGYTLIGKVDRIYAPFDAPQAVIGSGEVGAGEANTYGGYLIIIMSLAISLFCYSNLPVQNLFYLFFIIFSLVPFAYTLSRSSYLGIVPAIGTILILTEKKRNFLLGLILVIVLLSPILFKDAVNAVVNRVKVTFSGPLYSDEKATIFGLQIEDLSALARVSSWKKVFTTFLLKRPILGYGVTGVGLVDTQIPLILGEVGLVGFFTFFWLIFKVYKETIKIFKTIKEQKFKPLPLCIISSLTGLLFQSIGANTFIIIRIMEPFWFLCGMVMVLEFLSKEEVVNVTR